MSIVSEIKKEFKIAADAERAKVFQRFFKTGKGQYGEGDVFIGIKLPDLRKFAKKYADLGLKDLKELLDSKIHEHRTFALAILVKRYVRADTQEKKKIVDFYLKNTKRINNWDLVDISCPNILGDYLLERDKSVLYKLAKSKNLWERRIAIIATFGFIRKNCFNDTLKISEILLNDKHDLIHKAVGWMLREVGKRSFEKEEEFLKKYYQKMPRTMLRYAIERFPEELRQDYLKGRI